MARSGRRISAGKRGLKSKAKSIGKAISSKASPPPTHPAMSAQELIALRDVFWCNVAQEMLNGLSVLSQQHPEMFDGRFAVLTQGGERIPIAKVEPVFACSLPFNQADRGLSIAVQATVFRVQTPAGEVFTLPLHEVRALHALTPELLAKMQQAIGEEGRSSGDEAGGASTAQPFGLAAFAALPKKPAGPAPVEPAE
jgi:hypothetical protein